MRGLRQVLCVVLENVVVDAYGICSLYVVCEEAFTDEVIDTILDKAEFRTAWAFHKQVRKRNMRMIHRLLDEELGADALHLLDETCDQETFTRTLLYNFNSNTLESMGDLLITGMKTMKSLGYKRKVKLFRSVLAKVWNEELIREMMEEHPRSFAGVRLSQRAIDTGSSLEFKHCVAMHAIRVKGVYLKMMGFFQGHKAGKYWKLGLRLLLEIVKTPSEAYQLVLDAVTSDVTVAAVLRAVVEGRSSVDATSHFLESYCVLEKTLGVDFLIDAVKKHHIRFNDEKLAERPYAPYTNKIFKLATRNCCQEFPKFLRGYVIRMKHQTASMKKLRLCFVAFCNIVRPDTVTGETLSKKLKCIGLDDEAKFITRKLFH